MREKAIQTRNASDLVGHLLGQSFMSRMRGTFQTLLRTADPPKRLISIEERMAIGPKKSLILVNCAGRRFLFASSDDSMTPLVEVKALTETVPSTRVSVIGYLGDKL